MMTKRRSLNPEQYAHLRAEAKAPYRGLRRFVYVSFGASGLIGAVIFVTQLAAGTARPSALPNLALQVALIAGMLWLWQQENKAEQRQNRPTTPPR